MAVPVPVERHDVTAEFRWPRPPVEGYTADDLDRLPGLPDHTELIDGGLVFMSPRMKFHARMVRLLENALIAAAPAKFEAIAEMTIKVAKRQRPEPDVIVLDRGKFIDDDTVTWFPASAVVLAVEVVSPDSEIRDRERKPVIYAEAGIEYFWLVERVGGKALVKTFELNHDERRYRRTGEFRQRLVIDQPFPLDIDLSI